MVEAAIAALLQPLTSAGDVPAGLALSCAHSSFSAHCTRRILLCPQVLYSVFNISKILLPGKHTIGVELGNGWWNPLPMRFWGHVNVRTALIGHNGTREPMFKLLVVALLPNGSSTIVTSSAPTRGWRSAGSPTTANNIYLGERYDAQAAMASEGWAMSGFDDSAWTAAVPVQVGLELGRLEAQSVPPIRPQGALVARQVSARGLGEQEVGGSPGWVGNAGAASGTRRVPSGTQIIFDVGKNLAGQCRFHVGGAAGKVVSMRYGELLTETGALNVMTSVAGQIKAPNPSAPCQYKSGTRPHARDSRAMGPPIEVMDAPTEAMDPQPMKVGKRTLWMQSLSVASWDPLVAGLRSLFRGMRSPSLGAPAATRGSRHTHGTAFDSLSLISPQAPPCWTRCLSYDPTGGRHA